MIKLQLINGTDIVLNADLIEFIEATPDTIISLSNGKKMIVKETVAEIIDRVIEFRQKIGVSYKEFVPGDSVVDGQEM